MLPHLSNLYQSLHFLGPLEANPLFTSIVHLLGPLLLGPLEANPLFASLHLLGPREANPLFASLHLLGPLEANPLLIKPSGNKRQKRS